MAGPKRRGAERGEDGRCTRKSLPPPHAPATREKVRKPGNRASWPAGTPAGPGSTQTWASWGRNSRQRLLQAPRFLGPRGEGRTACESRGRAHWGGEAEAEGSAAHSDRGAQTKKCAWNRHAGRPAAQPVPCPGRVVHLLLSRGARGFSPQSHSDSRSGGQDSDTAGRVGRCRPDLRGREPRWATPGATAGWPRRQRSASRCAPLWERRARARHAAPARLREGPGEFSGFGKSRA